jgi:hypothetical protein
VAAANATANPNPKYPLNVFMALSLSTNTTWSARKFHPYHPINEIGGLTWWAPDSNPLSIGFSLRRMPNPSSLLES